MNMERSPAVAGQFYAESEEQLRNEIRACFQHPLGPGNSKSEGKAKEALAAAIVPHAGYMYSGAVAAHVYQRIAQEPPAETFIILGPNHRGRGAPIALYPQGSWLTPLGAVGIDSILAERLLKGPLIKTDTKAHAQEHSIEVQLPFLQTVVENFTFVPISLIDQTPDTAKALGALIAQAVREDSRRVVIIASSDFSHYVSQNKANRDDLAAIEKILSMEVDNFYEEVIGKEITICGYGPIMAAMTAASLLGVKTGQLLKHATSGDVSPMPQVVGYAAITFAR